MENIVLQPVPQECTDFMSLPMGVSKNIQYYNSIQGRDFWEANLCKKDDCMYYTYNIFKIKKSKNGYYRQNKQKFGLTFNEKKKLNVWFGKSIFEMPGINLLFNHLNLNWLNSKFQAYVTKSIAEKILSGKITNNIDVLKAYIKVMRLNCSPKLLYNVIDRGDYAKPLLLQFMAVAKDQNHLLEYCLKSDETKPTSYIMMDLVKQAHILDRKIDYMWSIKRMEEEHIKWTKDIMDVEVNDMEDVVIDRLLPLKEFNASGMTLLTTKKEIYTEGKSMNHCIYTNYWSSVERGHYLVYHVDFFGEQATLGCYIADKISFNQCYRNANRPVSEELKKYVEGVIADLNVYAKQINFITEEILPY